MFVLAEAPASPAFLFRTKFGANPTICPTRPETSSIETPTVGKRTDAKASEAVDAVVVAALLNSVKPAVADSVKVNAFSMIAVGAAVPFTYVLIFTAYVPAVEGAVQDVRVFVAAAVPAVTLMS